uniref:Uncharacterized protein n=1 Tax=Odontella aurita TaxID=265563 RepID=A0A7S4IJN4_9STRA|mmetsp:Transcript_26136/g.77356  ORF Transcript_26136/g.77356 Transcript_26136/m.77356 type:complete len:234 (+) Transcript_26136:617-1318(+)
MNRTAWSGEPAQEYAREQGSHGIRSTAGAQYPSMSMPSPYSPVQGGGNALYEMYAKRDECCVSDQMRTQFFEHEVVIRDTSKQFCYPKQYQVVVIPRFKRVDSAISKEPYCTCCEQSTYSVRMYVTRSNTMLGSFLGSSLYTILSPEPPNEEFLIQYVYGAVHEVGQMSHTIAHLTAASVSNPLQPSDELRTLTEPLKRSNDDSDTKSTRPISPNEEHECFIPPKSSVPVQGD